MNLKGRNKLDPTFNMASMTDIVFLLLIFFMLTSSLVTVSAIDVLLPKAGGKTENNTSITVSISSDALFYIDKTNVTESELEIEILKSVGEDKKKTIIIRGDKEAAYENVMKVIDIANKNKLKMILAVKGN